MPLVAALPAFAQTSGVLVLALKNNQPNFMGAASELAPFCDQTVTVDGLLLDDPDLGAKHVYQVQTILPADASEPVKATTSWGPT